MTISSSYYKKALVLWLLSSYFVCLFCGGIFASEASEMEFDLPADTAEKAIKNLSRQTALEIFFPSSVTLGVRTNAVKGVMTPQKALESMLAGTGVVVVRGEMTGALSLKR